jgi:hypothetical protein
MIYIFKRFYKKKKKKKKITCDQLGNHELAIT